MSRRVLAAVAACAVLLLPACSGDDGSGPDDPTPAQRLAAAKEQADSASSVHLLVTSRDVPDTAEGILGVDGVGTHAPAFKGVLDARMRGISAKIDAVAIGPDLWLKLPFTPRHVKTDPASWGVPSPAQLLSPEDGLTALITHTQTPQDAGPAREGQEVLRTITGLIPGVNVEQILNTGDPNGTYQVSYGLTDPDGLLRKASITGPFFDGATSTYDVVFDRYGEPVEITAPAGSATGAPGSPTPTGATPTSPTPTSPTPASPTPASPTPASPTPTGATPASPSRPTAPRATKTATTATPTAPSKPRATTAPATTAPAAPATPARTATAPAQTQSSTTTGS